MKIDVLLPPFAPEFEAIIPVLYADSVLQVKQSQPYASDFLIAGFLFRDTNGKLLGRAALYNNPALFLEGRKVIALGAYECVDDPFACRTLLDAALAYVHTYLPHAIIVGPMDGSS